jgi:RNA polymerase sigma-70 factor (sigma-E family)
LTETTRQLAFRPTLVAASSEATRGSKTGLSRKLEALYHEQAPGLGRLAYLLTGDAAVAEDLVQEAFVRAFARLAHLRRQDAVAAYLRRTVVNLAHKHFRRERTERAYLQATREPLDAVSQPDVALRDELWNALRELPPRQRSALVLRFYEDISEKEAARLLGCRVGTVKSLVHRALSSMREQIGGDYR